MTGLGLNEIREKYLKFFESKLHLRLPSSSLVPKDDATLFLVNAGMTPLKSYFTGKEIPPSKRVTTCQKCIRTPDIERVGQTSRHGTFFEMLGNFSFGDYFKKDGCVWAWEFVTQVLGLPVERLWISIYEEDEDTFEIWAKLGVSPEKIVRLGREDNFWEIGTGPCGPCSELYYDRGVEFGCGPDCSVGCDCDRFTEFWNLVFTQFDKQENGEYLPLKYPNIDTGMGLERIACIMQGTNSLFEIDTIRSLLDAVSQKAGVKYGENKDVSLRIVTDHIRSSVFMIGDGIFPSNEGREYVLRRLIRRAARHGRLLGLHNAFLFELAGVVIENYGEVYRELRVRAEHIKDVIKCEEERFAQTVDQGLNLLNEHIELLRERKADNFKIDGDFAFKLYDTYGFPLDLTTEIAKESGLELDLDRFEVLMLEQREKARNFQNKASENIWSSNVLGELAPTVFVGYSKSECEAVVLAIQHGGVRIDSTSGYEEFDLVLDNTVFFAQSGGQVGDIGQIESDNFVVAVVDTKKINDKFVHKCRMRSGVVLSGASCTARIDYSRRRAISRNHSAVHLLQKALRDMLGDHVQQAGSYVADNRFRFDFSHFAALNLEQLQQLEDTVNEQIFSNLGVNIFESTVDEARKMGALALFNEKYAHVVRVVQMGDYSTELCAGCHVCTTGEIGLFKITSETGVAANIRRIEGATGLNVLRLIREKEQLIDNVSSNLKVANGEVVEKSLCVSNEIKNMKANIDKLNSKIANLIDESITSKAIEINGLTLIAEKLIDDLDVKTMRAIGDSIRKKYNKVLIVLASVEVGKIRWVAMANKSAVDSGIDAGFMLTEVAKITDGKGGGRPDSAQASGNNPGKIDDALQLLPILLKS